MRPKYLEVEGLQSFKEKQEIDFDKLGESGLFGIFGPTGSGKSTLLDAITLALYGNVQRANRGTQGIANTDMNTVKVSFTFDLLRGGETKTYKVERAYKRKKSSDNSVEIKVARLFEMIDEESLILADKPAEVTQKVEELIGLQLDDFTRSVVLPQNKFQEFLLMDKAKKRDMMERIFYLEDYGRNLTEKVARKLSSIRYSLSGLEGAMSTLGDLSERALIEAESTMQKIRARREDVEAGLTITEVKYSEAKEIWELTSDLKAVINREKEHGKGLDIVNIQKNLYDKAMKAASVSDVLLKYVQVETSLQNTLQQLERVNHQLPALKEALDRERIQYEDSRKEAELQKPLLIEQKTKLSEAVILVRDVEGMDDELRALRDNYKSLKSRLESADRDMEAAKEKVESGEKTILLFRQQMEALKIDPDYRQQVQLCSKVEDELAKLEKDKKNLDLKLEELTKRISFTEVELTRISENRELQEKEMEGLQCKLKSMNDCKPGDRDDLMHQGEQYHALKSVFESVRRIKEDIDAFEARSAELDKQINIQKSVFGLQQEEREKREQLLKRKKVQVEELQILKENYSLIQLSTSLREGTACPVCGSVDHPSPAHTIVVSYDDNTGDQLEAACAEMEAIQKSCREMEVEAIKRAEQLNGLENQRNQLGLELTGKKEQYGIHTKTLPEDIRSLTLEDAGFYIENMNKIRSQKLKELGEWEKSRQDLDDKILKLQELLSIQKLEENKRQVEVQISCENLTPIKNDVKEVNAKLEQTSLTYKNLLEELGITQAHNELQCLDANHRKAIHLQKQVEEVDADVKTLRAQLEKMEKERLGLTEMFHEVKTQGEILKVRREETGKKIFLLTEGKDDIQAGLKYIEEKMMEYEQSEKRMHSQVKALEASYNAAETQRQTLDNQKAFYSEALEAETIRLQQMLKEKGFLNIEEARSCLLPESELDRMKKEIENFQEIAVRIEAQKQIIRNKLHGRGITDTEWNEIKDTYAALKQQKDECISAYENAKNQYQNYKKNFEQWLVLNREKQKCNKKKEILEQIQRLLKGNSFIEFISEERLRYVAKEATETLGVLTKHRYALELDAENGFVIRDHANGGVHRLVSSLSGGETFLTSLALALALSSQIQLKGQSPLEFFFLDEGFGTLDEDLLNIVVDSLERLSSTKKVIGLISHVPELRNRIPRRLVIEPPSADGRGSRVRLEKA